MPPTAIAIAANAGPTTRPMFHCAFDSPTAETSSSGGTNDPYFNCRVRANILITDGAESMSYRGRQGNCDASGECPARGRRTAAVGREVELDGALGDADLLDLLSWGDLEVVGRIAEASNATLLATVTLDGETRHCVYKPVTGERPLWDFPTHTLYRREVAAYLVSAAAGWSLVPPTVLRDGPAGEGSVQAWIYGGDGSGYRPAPEPGAGVIDVVAPDRVPRGWLTVLRAQTWDGDRVALAHADDPQLRAMAAFDVVVFNNTTMNVFLPDKKSFDALDEAGKAAARDRDLRLRKNLLEFIRSGKGVDAHHSERDGGQG